MTQLELFQSPKTKGQKRQSSVPIRWAEPVTLAEMIEGRKGMAAKMMNTDVWPERPELYKGPKTKFIRLVDFEDMASQMSGKRKRKPEIVLGPFHTGSIQWLPLSDRRRVLDVMIKNPWFSQCPALSPEQEKPRRKLEPVTLEIVRKRRSMKRVLKKFGMFADEMVKQEYSEKKMPWTELDDRLWSEEKQKSLKPKKIRKSKGAMAK